MLSDGRAELGLGAGYAKSEHDDAEVPFPPIGRRIEALELTVTEVRRRLADPGHEPRPVQRPVPTMVAAMSRSGLAVAARHADIVGFAGLRQVPGAAPGTLTLVSAAETADRVAEVRRLAAGRPYQSDVLLQEVVIGKSPERAAAEMAAADPTLTEQQILGSPFLLHAADADQERGSRSACAGDGSIGQRPRTEKIFELLADAGEAEHDRLLTARPRITWERELFSRTRRWRGTSGRNRSAKWRRLR